jgi:hypothetical protein
MPKFRVRMQGTHTCWPSDWNVGRDIKLLKCTFARISLEQTQNLSIELEVEAPSEGAAMDLGKERISKEFDLFALCAENPLYLDENRIWADGV